MDPKAVFDEMCEAIDASKDVLFLFVDKDEPLLPGRTIHRHNTMEVRFILKKDAPGLERVDIVSPGVCHYVLPSETDSYSHSLTFGTNAVFFRHKKEGFGYLYSKYTNQILELNHFSPGHGIYDDFKNEFLHLIYLFYLKAEITNEHPSDNTKIGQMIRYLQNYYYRQNISIREISLKFGYSANYVQRLFQKITGLSPKEYLLKVRMENALLLVKENRYLIKEIASLCGFADPHYFTNTFHRYYGVAPKKKIKQKRSKLSPLKKGPVLDTL